MHHERRLHTSTHQKHISLYTLFTVISFAMCIEVWGRGLGKENGLKTHTYKEIKSRSNKKQKALTHTPTTLVAPIGPQPCLLITAPRNEHRGTGWPQRNAAGVLAMFCKNATRRPSERRGYAPPPPPPPRIPTL